MITIIAGPRDYFDYLTLCKAIAFSGFNITEVVSGGAKGVDYLGEKWAREHNIPIKQFLPDWMGLGKAAGPIRNEQMAKYAEALIVLLPYKSPGTTNMIKQAEKFNLCIYKYY